MRKETVTLGTDVILEGGLYANVSLAQFREQLKQRGYTEIGLTFKGGKHVVEFVTAKLNPMQLIDAGLTKGTKEQRKDYSRLAKDKKNNFGYAW